MKNPVHPAASSGMIAWSRWAYPWRKASRFSALAGRRWIISSTASPASARRWRSA